MDELTKIAEQLSESYGIEEMICSICGKDYDTSNFFEDEDF